MLRRQLQYVSREGPALAAGVAVSNLLAVLVPITYNAFRSVEGYGIYTFIMSVLAVAGMSSLSGMNSAILVAAAQEKFHILRTATRRRVLFSLALGCPGLLTAGLVMLQWFPQQRLAGYACLILLPLFPFLYSFTGVYSYLTGRRQYWLYALATIGAAWLNLVAVAGCLWLWPDRPLLPPLAALALKTLYEAAIYTALVARDRVPLKSNDRHLLAYGMKITLTGITGNTESHLDRLVVGAVYGNLDLGMFGAGRAIVQPLRQLAQIYYQLYAPKLARKSPAEALRLTHHALLTGLFFIVPSFALAYWLLPWLYATFLDQFNESGRFARWFLVMVVCGVPFYFYWPLFQSQRQARREIIVRWTRTALIVVGLIVFVFFYGIMGVIYAQILATAVMSLQSWWEARKSRALGNGTVFPPPPPAGENGQIV